MPPSDQGLQRGDTAGNQIDLRLINKEELLIGDRVAQLGEQIDPIADLQVHGVIEEAKGLPAFRFGTVERHVRMREQSLGVGIGLGHGNADADAGVDLVGVDPKRQRPIASISFFANIPASAGSARSGINTANSSPPKRATVSDAGRCRQPLRHRLQQPVADRVAQRVVDVLEMIEIEIEVPQRQSPRRRASAIACSRLATNTPRLTRPVSTSNCAISISFSSASLRG